jgi:hypothetical protein
LPQCFGSSEEIVSIIAWIASNDAGYATDADLSVNGGCIWVDATVCKVKNRLGGLFYVPQKSFISSRILCNAVVH